MSTPRVFICTPIVTGVGPRAALSNAAMYKHIGKQTEYVTSEWMPGPRKSIREIRNRAVKEAKNIGATHLMFRDDDIIAPPDIIDQLLADDQPIVGALIHNSSSHPLVWAFSGGGEVFWHEHPINTLFSCWAIASGALLIKMDVFDKLSEPWFWFDNTARTMDVNFCRTVQREISGPQVWCDSRIICGQIDHDERVV